MAKVDDIKLGEIYYNPVGRLYAMPVKVEYKKDTGFDDRINCYIVHIGYENIWFPISAFHERYTEELKMPSIEITLGKIYKKKDAYGDYRPIGNPAPKYIVMQSLSKKDGDSITYLCFDLEKGSDVWMLEYVIQKLYEPYE